MSNVTWRMYATYKNIGTDLANVLWKTVAVQEVVLDLEVLSEGDKNGQGELVRVLVGHSALPLAFCLPISFCQAHHAHSQGNREVEGVEGGFVDDDEVVPTVSLIFDRERGEGSSLFEGELGQVDVVFWGCEQVDQLAHFRLEGGLTLALHT